MCRFPLRPSVAQTPEAMVQMLTERSVLEEIEEDQSDRFLALCGISLPFDLLFEAHF